jgi:uncharacterized protein (TIGR04141 family)
MKFDSDKIDLKIFKLNNSFYEFKDRSTQERIDLIKDNHLKKLRHKFDLDEHHGLRPTISHSVEGDFELWSYCYNQPKDQFYWKLFLPETLSDGQNFKITEFSFVLFMKYKSNIFCAIGGSGMSVIKKYIDPNFGINIYQHIAKPTEDILIELNARGIASNISQKRHTFNLNQTISETLEYSEIPTKIKLVLRKELKESIFKKYNLGSDRTLLEVGSYFYLRKRIDFEELKELVVDLDMLLNDDNFTQLTLFRKIEDDGLINDLDNTLQNRIINDVIKLSTPSRNTIQKDILEVVHPSKLERFYECNNYVIKAKYSRGKHDIEVNDRQDLYIKSIQHINNNTDDLTNRFEIGKKLFTLGIVGRVNEKELTYANFYAHIIAEIEHLGKKYFRIDGYWYFLKDEFLELMNSDAVEFYRKYELKEDLLNPWEDGDDEDAYNLSHDYDDYYVLDKVIDSNIELCDLLIIEDDKAYFVHVKDGFNAKMRDLYVQVMLSAKRLSNDIKNNESSSYLKKTLRAYKKKTKRKIDVKELTRQILEKEYQIIYVMAFKNNYRKSEKTIDKINNSKSNIAKYSIVQTVKEMQRLNFEIRLKDISDIE